MGCKTSKIDEKFLVGEIKKSIDADNYKAMAVFANNLISLSQNPAIIDLQIIPHYDLKFDLLGYSLYTSKPQSFTFLLRHLKASPSALITNFLAQKLNPIQTLCISGNLDIFAIFFPIFYENESLGHPNFYQEDLTPVQIATKNGHISILNFFRSFFQSLKTPNHYDFNYVNKHGDNCASIALKEGNYSVLKFLIEKCNAKLNKNYDLIGTCLKYRKINGNKEYLECIVYLVNVLNCTVEENHFSEVNDFPILSKFLENKFNETNSKPKLFNFPTIEK